MWEILTLARTQPLSNLTDEQVIENCRQCCTSNEHIPVLLDRPQRCSKELYDLMIACFNPNPSYRPTFKEIHMFLQQKNMGYNPYNETHWNWNFTFTKYQPATLLLSIKATLQSLLSRNSLKNLGISLKIQLFYCLLKPLCFPWISLKNLWNFPKNSTLLLFIKATMLSMNFPETSWNFLKKSGILYISNWILLIYLLATGCSPNISVFQFASDLTNS